MLFDLKSGKRRRVIQVVFGFLAFIFFISFVGFGIGSDVSGGIFDALGVGGGSGGSGDPQYEEQIEDAESRLETDPRHQRALLDLASYHYLSATAEGVSTDPETGTEVSEDSRQELEEAAAAWEDYLATKPQRPDTGTAANLAQAFVLLEDADGAATAQRIVAESQDSSAAYGQLAFYLYADLNIPEGDAAADQAVTAAAPSDRDSVRRNLERIAEQAATQKKQLEKQPQGATGGGQGIEDPFGALGGGTTAP
ncbi:MAG: hypothetical protein ACRDK9_11410 [Solirubrobacterales bacterium]